MSEILSQAEIDELLHALASGEEPETLSEVKDDFANVKVYDFRTANKFPKEQIRTFNIVFQTYGQLLANQLTGMMRVSCECELLSVEEISFNEFNNSLPQPVVLNIIQLAPLQGSLIMCITTEVAYALINRLLGGSGSVSGTDPDRPFTEIELALIERVVRQTLHVFEGAWEKVCTVDAQLERMETSTQFTQIVALNEPVAIVTLSLKIGDEEGIFSICIPHTAIEPVSKQLNTRLWYSGASESRQIESKADIIGERLNQANVTLTAYFEDTPATVYDIMNLHTGDVIRLNQKTELPILIKIQHIPKFYANIGTSGKNYAIQIVDTIKGDSDNDTIAR